MHNAHACLDMSLSTNHAHSVCNYIYLDKFIFYKREDMCHNDSKFKDFHDLRGGGGGRKKACWAFLWG